MEKSYDPFLVEIDTWYPNPELDLSFKIDYTPIVGTTLPPFGLICKMNGQLKIGPYGGPIREIIIIIDQQMQFVFDYSQIIDLRLPNKWVQAHYNGIGLPLFLIWFESVFYGVWVHINQTDNSQRAPSNSKTKNPESNFCVSCAGIGSNQCRSCSGTGYITESVQKSEWNSNTQSYEYRYVHENRACMRCSGSGRIICDWCQGRGQGN